VISTNLPNKTLSTVSDIFFQKYQIKSIAMEYETLHNINISLN